MWEMATTTKRNVAEGANDHAEQSVVVFKIVDFHRHRLELGVHGARQLTQQVRHHIQAALEPGATASVQPSGTIVALLPGDREGAERTARRIVCAVAGAALQCNGHREGVSVKLACGMISFSSAEVAIAGSISGSVQAPAAGAERDGVNRGILSEQAAEAI
jgi:hypothetical protein